MTIKTLKRLIKDINHMETTKSKRAARCSPPPCSLLPAIWGDRTIMVEVLPLTVGEFKTRAIAMLEAHIAWGEMVFPFIKANASHQRHLPAETTPENHNQHCSG